MKDKTNEQETERRGASELTRLLAPHWVCVDDNLPKKSGFVLVTEKSIYNGNINSSPERVWFEHFGKPLDPNFVPEYSGYFKGYSEKDFINKKTPCWQIVSWLPLPKPFNRRGK